MRYSRQIKPVSFVEGNARNLSEILDETGEPLILTEDGEARVVVQSVKSYEEAQDTIAFLQLLTVRLGDAKVERGIPLEEVRDKLLSEIRGR